MKLIGQVLRSASVPCICRLTHTPNICESVRVERSERKRESKCLCGASASISPTALVCPFRNVTGPRTPQEAG